MSAAPNHPLVTTNHDETSMGLDLLPVITNHDKAMMSDDIRAQLRAFSLERSEGPDANIIRALYASFDEHNGRFWGGGLLPVPILVTNPHTTRAFADASEFSGFGCKQQMRMRTACARGSYPTKFEPGKRGFWRMRPGHRFEDRVRWLSDVVLHEMIHLWLNQIDAPGRNEHQGHGAIFTAECNRIGTELGLLPVRIRRRNSDPRETPASPQWPHCVRPGGMYGAFYGDLWEWVPGEGEEVEPSQLQKLLAAYTALVKVWIDPATTDEDRERFMSIIKGSARDTPGPSVMISHDMGLAA